LLITRFDTLPRLFDPTSCAAEISAKRSKARKAAKTAKRAVAKAKPKRAPVKKAAWKVKQPVVAPVMEAVAVEVIDQPAPDVMAVTEVEETEVRKAS
jgi:hypothetical protein